MRLKLVLVFLAALFVTTGFSWVADQASAHKGHSEVHPSAKYKVVWEINDPAGTNNSNWAGALNNIENSLNEIGEKNTQMEVVAHGAGINLLNKEKSPQDLQQKIQKLQERGVVFTACANSMAKNGYTMDDMIDGVIQVPSGSAEVIRKQQQGWLYMHR